MPLPYAQNKVHIYKWVQTTKKEAKQIVSKYHKRKYQYDKQTKIFRNILIDFI